MKSYLHPVDITNKLLVDFFVSNGFKLKLYNEIRTVEEEFESVKIKKNNPVRDYSRTFYLDDENVLQAHMTAIRENIKKNNQGMYIIPGRIYRVNDEKKIRTIISHQLEGFIMNVPFSLKKMNALINSAFYSLGIEEEELRHTTDFTKFTSPTIQYYYKCHICKSKGCDACSKKGIICFAAGGVESESWDDVKKIANYSFCLSVDRLAMRKFLIEDMRKVYEG